MAMARFRGARFARAAKACGHKAHEQGQAREGEAEVFEERHHDGGSISLRCDE
jgi:hypothetical protein